MLGCSLPAAPERERLTLTSAGAESLDRLPLVPRLSLRGAFELRASDVWFVRGRMSDKELSQVLASAPGAALEAKRVPLSAWTSGDALWLAPLVVLEPGQEYTIVALSFGELARVVTSPSATPLWRRWGAGAVRPGGWVIHCAEPPPWVPSRREAESSAATSTGPLGRRALEPVGADVEIFAGFSAGSSAPAQGDPETSRPGPLAPACVRFQVPEGQGTLLPPHEIDGRFFEPTPLLIDSGPEAKGSSAPTLRVLGSAAFLDLPAAIAELSLSPLLDTSPGSGELLLRVETAAPSSLLLGQFPPGSYGATLALISRQGKLDVHALSFEVKDEQGYFVLSEVLTNPLGPEPESEWVEIVNIGRAPLSLEGFRLEAGDGGVPLPAVVLPSGGVGLVVRADFVAGASGDVVPAPAAIPIVVEELGDGGLSNSGELLRLRTPGGRIISEIPRVGTEAGTSLGRRHLLAPDWVSSFAAHAAPGASPGLPNEFD